MSIGVGWWNWQSSYLCKHSCGEVPLEGYRRKKNKFSSHQASLSVTIMNSFVVERDLKKPYLLYLKIVSWGSDAKADMPFT